MTQYVQYQTKDGDVIWVQIQDGEGEPQSGVVKAGRLGDKIEDVVLDAQIRFEEAMDTVRHSAQTIIDKIKGLSDPPDEVEVTFGLKAVGELGNFAIGSVGAEANYAVTLKWKREPEDKGKA
jgi:hypothetical protein